jgi:hypothetical protein
MHVRERKNRVTKQPSTIERIPMKNRHGSSPGVTRPTDFSAII